MIEHNSKESWTFWQEDKENGVAEPAILIEKYDNIICLTVGDNIINLNYDSLDELLRRLRLIKKEHDSE